MALIVVALVWEGLICAGLLGLIFKLSAVMVQRERDSAKERDKLLQRIQAPERAIVEDFQPSEAVQYVPFDDDLAFQRNREELNGD